MVLLQLRHELSPNGKFLMPAQMWNRVFASDGQPHSD